MIYSTLSAHRFGDGGLSYSAFFRLEKVQCLRDYSMNLNRMNPTRICTARYSVGDCFERIKATYGLGPPALQIGDSISVPAGATTTFALQPNTTGAANRYKLVGECHVHDMMYGEALGCEELQWQKIGLE